MKRIEIKEKEILVKNMKLLTTFEPQNILSEYFIFVIILIMQLD